MISRVADSCFWLHRYLERAESISRLIRVNRAFLLDINPQHRGHWHPAIVVTGEDERFYARYQHNPSAIDDAELVQAYLTWDSECPVSIINVVRWARENARTSREVISIEVWESVNALWHWLKGGQGRRVYQSDPDAFYQHVRDAVGLFQGLCHSTMLHDQPFDFMRLGMLLERAGQSARILDVKYHALRPDSLLPPAEGGSAWQDDTDNPLESAQWLALLRSCAGDDNYSRCYQSGISGHDVATFLLKEERFPRSVYHCLHRALHFLQRIQTLTQSEHSEATETLASLVSWLEGSSTRDVLARGLHRELARVIDETDQICTLIHREYFDSCTTVQRSKFAQ